MAAADAHFADVGFEAFSMAELARRAGVAKGTLYLYFETREQVLLTLYCEKLDHWVCAVRSSVPSKTTDRQFATALYETAYAEPSMLPLLARLDSVIEHNVSTETLIHAKRTMANLITRLSEDIAPKLQLPAKKAFDVIGALGALLLGASQVDAGPRVDDRDLPEDVIAFANAFASKNLFVTNACRIVAGVRAEN